MKHSGTTVSGGMSVSCGMRMTTTTATCANDDKINSPGILDWFVCVCVCVCVERGSERPTYILLHSRTGSSAGHEHKLHIRIPAAYQRFS
jgi:hypothetical protein